VMCKFKLDKSGNIMFKDGLVFTHMESLYEKEINPLVLQWRD